MLDRADAPVRAPVVARAALRHNGYSRPRAPNPHRRKARRIAPQSLADSLPMQELIDALVQKLNVDSKQAAGGAGILFKAARDKLGPGDFNQMLGGVAGIDELIREAPAAAGFGKLFGGVASAVGGGRVAMLAGVISGFGKLGLTQSTRGNFCRSCSGICKAA